MTLVLWHGLCIGPELRERVVDDYEKASFGQLPVGFGEKPGIVVIDFQICYTDATYPFGGAPLVMRALENTAKLLEVARRANVPVANCYTARPCRAASWRCQQILARSIPVALQAMS